MPQNYLTRKTKTIESLTLEKTIKKEQIGEFKYWTDKIILQ